MGGLPERASYGRRAGDLLAHFVGFERYPAVAHASMTWSTPHDECRQR
jgi:hypothetical protein